MKDRDKKKASHYFPCKSIGLVNLKCLQRSALSSTCVFCCEWIVCTKCLWWLFGTQLYQTKSASRASIPSARVRILLSQGVQDSRIEINFTRMSTTLFTVDTFTLWDQFRWLKLNSSDTKWTCSFATLKQHGYKQIYCHLFTSAQIRIQRWYHSFHKFPAPLTKNLKLKIMTTGFETWRGALSLTQMLLAFKFAKGQGFRIRTLMWTSFTIQGRSASPYLFAWKAAP